MGTTQPVEVRLKVKAKTLAQTKSDAKDVFFSDAVQNRPHHAQAAMEVIVHWSEVESSLTGIFVKMLGAEVDAAVTMYKALSGSAPKNAALRALAQKAFAGKPDHFKAFIALLRIYGDVASNRNALAHGIWGHTVDLPDAILLCDSRDYLDYQAEHAKFEATIGIGFWGEPPKPPPSAIAYGKIRVYTLGMILRVFANVLRLDGFMAQFRFAMMPAEWFDIGMSPDVVLQRLLGAPEVQTALLRPGQDRTPPQALEQSPPLLEPLEQESSDDLT